MTSQLWRLQDLRDGGGLGFTIELFFLSLRQLSPTSSSSELNRVFYTGTFEVIASGWESIKDPSGTQRILLNVICDLVIKSRGVFSDFSYPQYIAEMLLNLVGNMFDRRGYTQPHIIMRWRNCGTLIAGTAWTDIRKMGVLLFLCFLYFFMLFKKKVEKA